MQILPFCFQKQLASAQPLHVQLEHPTPVRLYRKFTRKSYPEEEEGYPLDSNHTHFILLDDCQKYPSHVLKDDKCRNCEIEECWAHKYKSKFRSDLILNLRPAIEKEARNVIIQGKEDTVPIVQILAEGGPSSILTVLESLDVETPVIVIDGTGRAANFISNCYRALYGTAKERSDELYKKKQTDVL
ncbi:unnamed protein product [Didymodactylos carnosus]|uniref:TRPM SLOG domain-containing protein n=1 Tax=Didymodactylos carnosus TaxID=1234261 RepID=A0A814XTM6_9BILA|nr:unnamed protein product [Didymodactylos carnosus]CAF1466836.1 unnamed protein product [Didymodactylos carnosus]CAF3983911.1 unnamed protein product [Didymodactylos carnosus]CAF4259325.1 unnamed protein product [Didymodactylos carnosus]